MSPDEFRSFRKPAMCRCVLTPVTEPFESMVARGIAGLEMLLREAAEDES